MRIRLLKSASNGVRKISKRWASQEILDMPGAVGSFASLRQMAAVISGVDPDGDIKTISSLNFNLIPGAGSIDSSIQSTLQGFTEAGRSEVKPVPCSFTLPHPLEEGSECIVHLMSSNAPQVVYHNLPPVLPFKKELFQQQQRDVENNSTIIGNWEVSGGGHVKEVLGWTQAVFVTIKSVIKLNEETYHCIGTVTKILNSDIGSSAVAPLAVSSFLGREELLLKSFRKRSLLIQDWDHEARLTLCWWFARKYGRNRSASLLPPNILTYLRSWQAEARFNKTEMLALLHLVSYSMLANSGSSSFEAFIEKEDKLTDPELLSSFYTPKLLLSRNARTEFVAPDKKGFEGPLYPTLTEEAVNEDSSLLPSEPVRGLDDEFRKGSILAIPVKPGKMPSNYEQWCTLGDGQDKMIKLGTPTALARPKSVEK
eukprot:TRINITY_DN15448_c0_g1_i1.p1 TRINITY_DN15448_c0_g1~~TRINITY_DN15448_c0_g1_i1.p1  ORF type:complete len:426 (+),score=62.16 TRINITY_DN15448_c0_g1_i1:45-1322(+)